MAQSFFISVSSFSLCSELVHTSTRALDFLYLDYKPPTPVGALITANVLSKYQRIFNFLLRLLRGTEPFSLTT